MTVLLGDIIIAAVAFAAGAVLGRLLLAQVRRWLDR